MLPYDKQFLSLIFCRKLAISRDINMLKVRRAQGSAVRGTRPITVCFERYQVTGIIRNLAKLGDGRG